MSGQLRLLTAGGGALLLDGTSTASDKTITFPATSGTLLTADNLKTINSNSIVGSGGYLHYWRGYPN